MIAHNLSAQLGRWDDPFLLEIKRSIAQWEHGPPPGYTPPKPQTMPQPVAGPTGQVVGVQAVQVMPPDPVALALFPPRPHHILPLVAKRRLDQLARLMASTRFGQQSPEWQQIVVAEYGRMQQAMTPAPVMPGTPGQLEPETQGSQTPDPTRPPSPSNPTLDPQPRAA
jgi:hypothetical protein